MTPADSTVPSVQLDDVRKQLGSAVALGGVSLSVGNGECVTLVGESGSGKTTLLRCINRLTDADSGSIQVNGQDVRSLDPVGLRRSVGYVPQEGGLLPHWNVLRNAALVPTLSGMDDAVGRAKLALESAGLDADTFGKRWPHELSGGQRQRVAIARALAAGQSLLLLDEPFGALDAITRGRMQREFARLRADRGAAAILVTHDISEALLLGDRVAVLREGRLEQIAAPESLVASPATDYVRQLIENAAATRLASA